MFISINRFSLVVGECVLVTVSCMLQTHTYVVRFECAEPENIHAHPPPPPRNFHSLLCVDVPWNQQINRTAWSLIGISKGVGGLRKNFPPIGGMDFWSYTMELCAQVTACDRQIFVQLCYHCEHFRISNIFGCVDEMTLWGLLILFEIIEILFWPTRQW